MKPAAGSSALLCALLLVAVALSACAGSANAAADAPFVMAHKKVALTRPRPGVERLAVSIDLYNQGSATAYDVSLNDDFWGKDVFEIISGTTSTTLERLDPGAAASHSFILETKVKGLFQASPAIIKFRVTSKNALQEAYSTPINPLDLLADKPPEKKFEWAKRLVLKYGALVAVLSFVGTFIYVLVTPSKPGAKGSKKRR